MSGKKPRGFLATRAAEILPSGGTILDLGAGDGSYWTELLESRGDLRYIGLDIYAGTPSSANAEIHTCDCTDWSDVGSMLAGRHVDLVVSKSTLEHVYVEHRSRFLEVARKALGDSGTFLLQYDQGHFMHGPVQNMKNIVASRLNRWGVSRLQYARPLDAQSFEKEIVAAGFEIRDVTFEGVPALKPLLTAIADPQVRAETEELVHAFERRTSKSAARDLLERKFSAVIWELGSGQPRSSV